MADTLKRLIGPTQVTSNTDFALTAVPSLKTWTVLDITVVNTGTSAVTVAFGIGGTSAALQIMPSISVDAGGFAEWSGKIMLAAGEALHVLCSAANVITITANGLEQG